MKIQLEPFRFPEPMLMVPIDFLLHDQPQLPIKYPNNENKHRNVIKAINQIKFKGDIRFQSMSQAEQNIHPLRHTCIVDCDASFQRSHHMSQVSPCITRSRPRAHWIINRNRYFTFEEMCKLQGIHQKKLANVESNLLLANV